MAARMKGRFIRPKEKERRIALGKRRVQQTTETGKNESTSTVWKPGERRIFEPHLLAKQLLDGCQECGLPLNFTNIVSETQSGLGSFLYLMCTCGTLNQLKTGKVHYDASKQKTRPIFDINSKAAIAMYDTGLGEHKFNRLFADLNMPGLSPTSLAKREKEVARSIAKVTEDSLNKSLQEEKNAILKESSQMDREHIPIKIKYDMGWQRRGSGRQYSSKSGVGVAVGNETGKILERDVKSKDCRSCTFWEGKGKEAPLHDCSRNWYGTSKGMEPETGVTLINRLEQKQCTVTTLIMDDDATTMARIKHNIDYDIEKWSDIKHVQNTLGKKLYSLTSSFKKSFRNEDVSHLMKCFSYAVHSNKNQYDSMKKDISAIVPHVFNCHEQCNPKWCRYLRDSDNYKPTISLNNQDLRKKLETIFKEYIVNIEKIVPCASTKENESFNNMLCQRAPKNKHYSGSKSLLTRVNCTVSQKNESFGYVSSVNMECGLSPGRLTEISSSRINRKRKATSDYRNSREYKKRKLSKKLQFNKENITLQIREGQTYQTEIDMQTPELQDTEEISQPIVPEAMNPIQAISESVSRIYFDLETTSLSMDCEIIQISARTTTSSFNQYIMPSAGISKFASEVTGLTVFNNFLCCNGKRVDSCSPQQGLQNFVCWIQETVPGEAILIGHNSKRFDAPRLLKSLAAYQLYPSFQEKVVGFVDSLPFYREKYPDMESHKQENLALKLLHKSYNAHDSSADVKILMDLLTYSDASLIQLQPYSFTSSACMASLKYTQQSKKRLETLNPLIEKKIITVTMAKKVCSSGLDLKQLKLAKARDAENGIRYVLSEKFNGKPRVTACKRVAQKISEYLQ